MIDLPQHFLPHAKSTEFSLTRQEKFCYIHENFPTLFLETQLQQYFQRTNNSIHLKSIGDRIDSFILI